MPTGEQVSPARSPAWRLTASWIGDDLSEPLKPST